MKPTRTILLASSLLSLWLPAQAQSLPPPSKATSSQVPVLQTTAGQAAESVSGASSFAMRGFRPSPVVAGAATTLTVQPNATVSASVSLRELNRVAVEGARIVDAQWREGSAEVSKTRGELRVIPAEGSRTPINLIVTTDKGNTYTLVLLVSDLPSQTLLLKDSTDERRPAGLSVTGPAIARSDSFEQTIKALLVSMASNVNPADVEVRPQTVEFRLWNEAKFVLNRSWTLKDLVGDRFILTNVSGASMRLAEQEFYKPGVHAIALDSTELEPGASTNVYIVRERADHD